MKRCFFLLLAVCALRAGGAEPSTTAHAGGWGLDDRTLVFGGGVTVTELPPELRGAAEVDMPRNLFGRPVTALAPGLFERCEALERVSLPASLKEIPARAFRGCVRLRAAELPAGVESVGESAFEGCASLRRAELPAATARL
ncbi:MAG: leucine-rich repeat protein, partial [Kiritimatiellae bacterium]|nr:leucine-rich repeat protein [Kiritimatiellia bacterium]